MSRILDGIRTDYSDFSLALLRAEKLYVKGDVLVHERELGRGAWIILAKATAKAESPQWDTLQLILSATEGGKTKEDRSLATVREQGYAAMSLMLGVEFASGGKVQLRASIMGTGLHSSLSNIAFAAVKTDKLLLGGL